MIKRKENLVNVPGAIFFVNPARAGKYYAQTGFMRKEKERGRRRAEA